MDSVTGTELNVTVKVDTESARRAVEEFRLYALNVIEEIRAAYASLGPAPEAFGEEAEISGIGAGRRV